MVVKQLPFTLAQMPLATRASHFWWEAASGFVALKAHRRSFPILGNPVFKLAVRGFIVPAWLWQKAQHRRLSKLNEMHQQ